MRYALIDSADRVLRYESHDKKPPDPIGKGWRWEAAPEPEPPPPPPPPRRAVEKLLLVDRLEAAGLFKAAMFALGGPGELTYERWSAARFVYADDPQVVGLLKAIGGDADALLAPEIES